MSGRSCEKTQHNRSLCMRLFQFTRRTGPMFHYDSRCGFPQKYFPALVSLLDGRIPTLARCLPRGKADTHSYMHSRMYSRPPGECCSKLSLRRQRRQTVPKSWPIVHARSIGGPECNRLRFGIDRAVCTMGTIRCVFESSLPFVMVKKEFPASCYFWPPVAV